ncbi:MAG: PEP-CTERM sorting domain-containing protein [Deltaproteobacteria bacterium]
MKRKILGIIGAVALGLACTATANATALLEVEGNDSFATAQSLNGYFSPAADPDIFGSLPTASVSGLNSSASDVDYYSFSVVAAGIGYFDIDYGMYDVDTTLSLFDSGYNLLAYVDDSWPEDPGTAHPYDSFLGTYTFTSGGLYYIAVTDYANFPLATGSYVSGLTSPGGAFGGNAFAGDSGATSVNNTSGGFTLWGGDYTLHASIENPGAQVPEPSTLLLLGGGFAGLLFAKRLRKK